MAPHVTTVLTVARAGVGVVRYLIRPAQRAALDLSATGRDPWLEARPPARLRRGASVARRGLGLAVLLVLALLGASVVGTVAVLLGIGAASGSAVAGWLLGFTLLLGLLGTCWTGRRALNLLRAGGESPTLTGPGVAAPSLAEDEAGLLRLLRRHERALPRAAREALRRTALATRDALRASAGETTLSRDAYDARQVARAELPELLGAYHAAAPSPQAGDGLLEHLQVIETRMARVAAQGVAARRRALSAQGRYLGAKYRGEAEE